MTSRQNRGRGKGQRGAAGRPALSIVVVPHGADDARRRSLASLSREYQQGVEPDAFEVIVVDNGADPPLSSTTVPAVAGEFRLVRLERAAPLAQAIQAGVREARGDTIGAVDGASIASPGLVRYAIAGARMHPMAAIATFNWDLGYDLVPLARHAGWSEADENRLLAEIAWPADGYALFGVGTLDLPSVDSWFSAVMESNAYFLPASVWERVASTDPNHDHADRGAAESLVSLAAFEDLGWVVLLSEATFRQVSADSDARPPAMVPSPPPCRPVVLGAPPATLRPQVARALEVLFRADADRPRGLGRSAPDADALASSWLYWAQVLRDHGKAPEAAAFARRAREAVPTSPAWATYLRSITRAETIDALPTNRQAAYYSLAGDALERAGEPVQATAEFERALTVEPTNAAAYTGLSRIRMPGPMYDEVLRRVHEELVPATYLEIGVFQGASLSLARPPTVAVAIDPEPIISLPISVEYHLYPERSSEFFEQHDVRKLLGGGPTLVFIDGLHHFPVVLDDFRHVEAIADPETIVVLHDVMPFDEITQRPERACEFYTGDCWKLLHCLAEARPTLSWFTVPTAPSGLAFVSGLDPSSSVLWNRYDELVATFGDLGFEHAAHVPGPVVENRWDAIAAQLQKIRPVGQRGASPPTVPAEATPPEILARRLRTRDDELRQHEEREHALVARLQETEDGATAERLQSEAALRATRAQLEAYQNSRVLRVTRPLRALYEKLRGRRSTA